jgi:hypothetical protein
MAPLSLAWACFGRCCCLASRHALSALGLAHRRGCCRHHPYPIHARYTHLSARHAPPLAPGSTLHSATMHHVLSPTPCVLRLASCILRLASCILHLAVVLAELLHCAPRLLHLLPIPTTYTHYLCTHPNTNTHPSTHPQCTRRKFVHQPRAPSKMHSVQQNHPPISASIAGCCRSSACSHSGCGPQTRPPSPCPLHRTHHSAGCPASGGAAHSPC